MTTTQKTSLTLLLIAALCAIGFVSTNSQPVKAAGGFLPATIATTSVATVTSTASTVIATSTCAARIISTTGAGGIMITFTDNQGSVPSATFGFWQPSSSTVSYDSGLYGCGAVKVYSGVTQIITVSDSR